MATKKHAHAPAVKKAHTVTPLVKENSGNDAPLADLQGVVESHKAHLAMRRAGQAGSMKNIALLPNAQHDAIMAEVYAGNIDTGGLTFDEASDFIKRELV